MTMTQIPAHVTHRIAEAVGNGWPSYEVTDSEVQQIIELAEQGHESPAIAIKLDRRLGLMAIEAVLCEAHTYGFEGCA